MALDLITLGGRVVGTEEKRRQEEAKGRDDGQQETLGGRVRTYGRPRDAKCPLGLLVGFTVGSIRALCSLVGEGLVAVQMRGRE